MNMGNTKRMEAWVEPGKTINRRCENCTEQKIIYVSRKLLISLTLSNVLEWLQKVQTRRGSPVGN